MLSTWLPLARPTSQPHLQQLAVSDSSGSQGKYCPWNRGVHGLELQWQRVSPHSQVAVGFGSLYEALKVQASRLSISEKGGFCHTYFEPVEPVCAWAAVGLLVWYPLSRLEV